MKVTKGVWQYHEKGSELRPVFDYFRFCTNEAIRIGSQKQNTSRFSMHKELYLKLRGDFYAKYVHGSLECAASKLKQYRKAGRKKHDPKIPYVWKSMFKLDNQSYKISDGHIRIPIKARQYCVIKLTSYVLEQLENTKLGSITVTESKLIISYSKEIEEQKPSDFVAIDRNLDNITTFDTKNDLAVHDLHKATKIKERYRRVKSRFRCNDIRIRKKIFQKYGAKEKNRVHQILHSVSKKVVSENKGIIMEDIKGIRKLYRKGNGQGEKFRHKMNSWSFYELQRQIEYKARWLGLPVKYVKAYGTSSKCAVCGSGMVPEEHRTLFCPCCNVAVDRDINAARNILARGTRDVPDAVQGEAMKQSKDAEQIVLSQVFSQPTKT
ncbi:MAG: RNA-guided endonuclease InsQ/TnpB family protein [Candidatus Nitrosotenuis sp.]